MKSEFCEVASGFLWTVSYKEQKVVTAVGGSVTDNVTDNRRNQIVGLMKNNKKITTVEIANAIGVVRRTIARDIELIKKSGVIERIGSDISGFWKVNEDKEV